MPFSPKRHKQWRSGSLQIPGRKLCIDVDEQQDELVGRHQTGQRCMFCGGIFGFEELSLHVRECKLCPTMIRCNTHVCSSEAQAHSLSVTEMNKLTITCAHALHHLRMRSVIQSGPAMELLVKRGWKLGYRTKEVRAAMDYLKNQAPILIHFGASTDLASFVEDMVYRSRFETGRSRGDPNLENRSRWESNLFQGCYDGCDPSARVKYGVLSFAREARSIPQARTYGDSYFVLKPSVRGRCSMTPFDSATNDGTIAVATLDQAAHVVMQFSDEELCDIFNVGARGWASSALNAINNYYKEVQIHGKVDLTCDIEALVLSKRHRAGVGLKLGDLVTASCDMTFGPEVVYLVPAGAKGVVAGGADKIDNVRFGHWPSSEVDALHLMVRWVDVGSYSVVDSYLVEHDFGESDAKVRNLGQRFAEHARCNVFFSA